MNVLFVWPNMDASGFMPIGISILSSLLKAAGHTVSLFDTTFIDTGGGNNSDVLTANGIFKPVDMGGIDISKKKLDVIAEFDKALTSTGAEVVCISALADEIPLAKTIAKHAVSKEIPVVWGGKGPTMDPDSVFPRCVVVGEGLIALPKMISSGWYNVETVIRGEILEDLDTLPYLDWSIFDKRQMLKKYDGKLYVGADYMIAWGCPGKCSYCINESYRDLYEGAANSIRSFSVDRVIKELVFQKKKYGLEMMKFHDEDFLLKPKSYMRELSDRYAEDVGIHFTCMTNAKSVTPDRAAMLAKMGCVSVSIGIESGNNVIRQILRRRETKEEIIRAVKILSDEGIRVCAFNMIGLPFDTEETILETIELNRAANVKNPNVSIYVPLKGTKLYDISVAYGFWNKDDVVTRIDRPVLRLPGITPEKIMHYYSNFHSLVINGV